jgi:hypothetical protein
MEEFNPLMQILVWSYVPLPRLNAEEEDSIADVNNFPLYFVQIYILSGAVLRKIGVNFNNCIF